MRFRLLTGLLFFPILLMAQLPVVINEVMVSLPGGRGPNSLCDIDSLSGNVPSDDAQWIEFYNPDPCHSYDISCYVIGSNMSTPQGDNWAIFPLPGGTVIPPLGHFVVGGDGVAQTDINVFEFLNTNFCASDRWWLNDTAGWIGLFDPSGNPVTVVFWSLQGQPGDLYIYPQFTQGVNADPQKCSCCTVGFLQSAASQSEIECAGQSFPGSGFSLARKTDGSSSWVTGPVGGTPGACNGGIDSCFSETLVFAANPPTCHNGGDGSISVSVATQGISLSPYNYHWSTGSLNDTLSGLSAGVYTVTVQDVFGCPFTASYTLPDTPPLSIPVSSNSPVCPGDTLFMSANFPAQNYAWSGPSGFSSSSANPFILQMSSVQTGMYTLSITDNDGCPGIAQLSVSLQPFPDDLFPTDTLICEHETLILSAPDNGSYQYLWSVLSSASQAEVYSPQNALLQNPFWVSLTLTGCKSITDSIKVTVEDCPITIPNVFTPNGDGYNDVFVIEGLEHYPGSVLSVYHRYGRLVCHSDDYQNNWSAEGEEDGVYYYVLLQAIGNGKFEPRHGFIHIISYTN